MNPAFNPGRRVCNASRQSLIGALAAAALLVAAGPAGAINRCEARDGRVTYTDEPCPPTARSARKVDDSPPLRLRESPPRAREAKEPEAGSEAKAAEPSKAAAAPALAPSRAAASATPEQEIARLDELRARQQQLCAQARRRAEFAANDLQAAGGSDRASAELALRRAQEEVRTVCPPQ